MPLLELSGVTKHFSGVAALEGVALTLDAGQVHAIVGENGAGKSTLINIISGVLAPDSGVIQLDGQTLHLANPRAARRQGILTVHQEVEVFPSLSLAENLALSSDLPTRMPGIVDWREIQRTASQAVESLHERIDVGLAAGRLTLAQRQMARIAAALSHHARVLLLDEPTSTLSDSETRWLFSHIQQLRSAGLGIVYISHRIAEIFELADCISVLRDGRVAWSGAKQRISRTALIEAMVGRQYQPPTHRSRTPLAAAPARLVVDGLSDGQGRFHNIRLDVRAGEIVGIYGLVGAGRSEFAQAVFGLRPAAHGKIAVNNQPVALGDPEQAIQAGIAYVPEDRPTEGVFPDLSVRTNTALCSLDRLGRGPFTAKSEERTAVADQAGAFNIRYRSIEQPIRELSGGNQQKAVLSRWLLTNPRVLLLDEPTRGVDVGAKAEIHRWLRTWVDQGNAAVMISSDLSEVIEHADRIIVFHEGRIVAEFDPTIATPEQIAAAALPDPGADRMPAIGRGNRIMGRGRAILMEVGLLLAIAALSIALAVSNGNFLTNANLLALFTNTAVWSILALAAGVVIIAGAIDISIGAILALTAASSAMVLKTSLTPTASIPLAILAALAVGIAAGTFNAGIVLVGRVHPIVITLATMTAYRGVLIVLTGGEALTDLPPAFDRLATAGVFGLNGSILTMGAVAIGIHLALRHSVWGRQLYALGSSPAAARVVGISKNRVWLIAFAVSGALCAVAGLLELATSGSMQASLGTGYELRAIAAAVIGGAAIAGGRGTALGVFSGALLISLVQNALVLWQVSRYHNDLVIGGLILIAVLWDLVWRKLDSG